jgi:hypothetical protein
MAAVDQNGYAKQFPAQPEAPLVSKTVGALFALGGFVVRCEKWHLLEPLVAAPSDDPEKFFYATWIRHAAVQATRASLDPISLGAGVGVFRSPLLYDAATEDEVLTSICKFDLLAGLVAIGRSEHVRDAYYPSFYRYRNYRVEPTMERLIYDARLRKAVFPFPDDRLAGALAFITEAAEREAFPYAGWLGIRSSRIQAFLQSHPAAVTR